jgi:orotate phosphoribosyltransferase
VTASTLDFPLLDVRCGDPALVRDLLARPGVVEHGHFELLSGLHSDAFVRFSALARDEEALRSIADWLTPSIKPWEVDAVVAPVTAGVALGWTLARLLAAPLHLATVGPSGRALETGALPDLTAQRVLIVNDVVTTGAGMTALASAVRDAGGEVAGAAWFASRATIDVAPMIAAPVVYVVGIELPAVAVEVCELCRREVIVERATDLN